MTADRRDMQHATVLLDAEKLPAKAMIYAPLRF
jgi:hypothetical protein